MITMTQILQKHPPALSIRAGKLARQLIQSEGLQADQVDIVPGAEVVIGMIDQFRFFALHQVEQHATANITDFLALHFFVKIEVGIEFT